MSQNDSTVIEYLKLQWADIHNSRSQDWSYIGVVAGVLYALVNTQSVELKVALSLLGLLTATLGAYMALQHHQIFRDKLVIIKELEQKLGIQYPTRSALLPVQILIFLLFSGVACTFVGMTLYFWSEISNYDFLREWSPLVGTTLFLMIFVCVIVIRVRKRHTIPFQYKTAYFAEQDKLEQCIKLLEDEPLKLIVDKRLTQSNFTETSWDQPEWNFFKDKKLIKKAVLLNRQDSFQFSMANESSRQEWHYHKFTYEIYVSNKPISLEYRSYSPEKTMQSMKVSKGLLIVPPGLHHKVALSGTTFVFQVTLTGSNLSEDKIILEG